MQAMSPPELSSRTDYLAIAAEQSSQLLPTTSASIQANLRLVSQAVNLPMSISTPQPSSCCQYCGYALPKMPKTASAALQRRSRARKLSAARHDVALVKDSSQIVRCSKCSRPSHSRDTPFRGRGVAGTPPDYQRTAQASAKASEARRSDLSTDRLTRGQKAAVPSVIFEKPSLAAERATLGLMDLLKKA